MTQPSDKQPTPAPLLQPPGYYMPMPVEMGSEDEIDLFELWMVLWGRRRMIIGISLLIATIAVVIALMLPNHFKAEVVLAPVAEKGGGGLSLGGLGGLASLAGVSVGGGGSSEQNIAVLESRAFLWSFIEERGVLPILFADQWDPVKQQWIGDDPKEFPTTWDGYRMLDKQVMAVSTDKESGLMMVSIEWTDPVLATEWANELVQRLNSHLRNQAIERSQNNLRYLHAELQTIEVADMRQTLFELIAQEQKSAMVANTQQEFAFRVIDPAIVPDKKSKPKRALMVVLATILGGMLGVFIAFIQHALQRRREQASA